eukprot:SAG22_NODE_112_length_19423_cov_11.462223_9_plen_64_part_00
MWERAIAKEDIAKPRLCAQHQWHSLVDEVSFGDGPEDRLCQVSLFDVELDGSLREDLHTVILT